MKFLELKIGDYFEFKGESYQKASPIIAVSIANGKQKMFKRSSVVTINQTQHTSAQSTPESKTVLLGHALAALETYHQENIKILQQLNLPQTTQDEVLTKLEQAKSSAEKSCHKKTN